MQFDHGNMTGVHLAAELVNLVARGAGTRSAIELLLREHEIRRPSLTTAAAALLADWGLRLRPVFTTLDVDDRCAALNALLTDGAAGFYLSTHDGQRPHLHFTPDEDNVVGRVRALTAGGLAVFTMEAAGLRLGVCARPGCPLVFVDTSRNGRRAYCSTRCGNNDAVQRHRDRTGTGRGPGWRTSQQ